ncbi:MAG: hypothetical protein M3424_08960 [Actinomycetota bacterium]|nr:hypothetical protein [Actinomycetota bacterium]
MGARPARYVPRGGARRLGQVLLRAADLLDGRVEAPEVRWERDSQTYLVECGCGWRYFASTLRHAQVQGSEHARDEHHV